MYVSTYLATLKFKLTIKNVHTSKIIHPKILVHGSNSLSGISNRSTLTFQLKYAGNFPYYAGKFPYYAGIILYAFQLLLCLKLCWHNRHKPSHI